MDEKLDEFHRLVADGRYREARGILETEPDIPPQVAEKWLLWLNELHHDEWVKAGIVSDLKKRDPERALGEIGKMIGGTLALIPAGVALWLLVNHVLTLETASVAKGAFFLLLSLLLGYAGWQWAASAVVPKHSFVVGAGVSGLLLVYVLTSGIPMWYFHEPPQTYLLAAFALLAPAVSYAAYRVGAWVGLGFARLIHRE
jgi:hypothetical protein